MKVRNELLLACLLAVISVAARAQRPAVVPASDTAPAPGIPVALDWTPPGLASLAASAEVSNSFVLNRTMLGAAIAMMPDSQEPARESLRKLDGIGVHLMRFHDEIAIDPAQLDLVRRSYHARGWKHLVAADDGVSIGHNGKTDLWLAVDGANVRGGTLLVVTPKSVSLVTFAGNLDPLDLLRLRGHFGIPGFNGDKFTSPR
jgi:hypothetical protein